MKLITTILSICFITFFADDGLCKITSATLSGDSITITGTEFGPKSTPEPVFSDGFEYGSNGNLRDLSSGNWTTYLSDGPVVNSNVVRTGDYSVENIIIDGDNHNATGYHELVTPSDRIYYSSWMHISTDSPLTGVGKMMRIGSTVSVDSYAGDGIFGISDWNTSQGPYFFYTTGDGSTYPYAGTEQYRHDLSFDSWFRVEFFVQLSSPAGSSNGIIQIFWGGEWRNITDAVTLATLDTYSLNTCLLGLMFTSPPAGTTISIHTDDVYIDNTRARVEIGDKEVFADCTHREIQIPTAWATDEISVTVNQGSFSDGSAYLFVVDKDGTVSDQDPLTEGSQGYPITFTASTTCTLEANKTVSLSPTTISGTYTLADGTTVASCTWSNGQGGSGTLTATGGVISGTITGLSTGANDITVVVTDSDGGTGTDSMTITLQVEPIESDGYYSLRVGNPGVSVNNGLNVGTGGIFLGGASQDVTCNALLLSDSVNALLLSDGVTALILSE